MLDAAKPIVEARTTEVDFSLSYEHVKEAVLDYLGKRGVDIPTGGCRLEFTENPHARIRLIVTTERAARAGADGQWERW